MIAKFDLDTLTVTAGGYSFSTSVSAIERNWHALSHFPDRRARCELSDASARLNEGAARIAAIAAAGGTIDVDAETERFARRCVQLHQRAWAMEGRCLSWFVVGPANFPTARNEKRQRSRDNAYAAIGEHRKAALESLERRAFPHGRPGGAIRASNPDAPELLRQKIEDLRADHAKRKAANDAIRKAAKDGDEAIIDAVMNVTGWSRSVAAQIAQPNYMGRRGFEAWEFSNVLAEIKRLEGRLKQIEATRERGERQATHETRIGTVDVVENPEAGRIQMVFNGKPDASVRAILKQRGFRWAPSAGAWQRHLNEAGREAARTVLSLLAA